MAIPRQKVVMVPIDKLRTTFYVRRQLNEDHMLHLAELYEQGANIPPIVVVRDTFEIMDGRHRKAALELLNRKEIEAVLVKQPEERVDLMAQAFKANVGGALPPTRADITMMMRELIEEGTTQKRIIAAFSNVYPPSLTRRYLKDAYSALRKTKLVKAINAVANGMTAPQAAEVHDVDLDALRAEISGRKRKPASAIADLKSRLTSQFKGNTLKAVALLKSVMERYEDGELTEPQAREVFDHVDHLMKHGLRSYRDRRARFEAKVKGEDVAPESDDEEEIDDDEPSSTGRKTLAKMGL